MRWSHLSESSMHLLQRCTLRCLQAMYGRGTRVPCDLSHLEFLSQQHQNTRREVLCFDSHVARWRCLSYLTTPSHART